MNNSDRLAKETVSPTFRFVVEPESLGFRLDVFIAQKIDGLSRAKASDLIRAGHVRINAEKPKASVRLKAGDQVDCELVSLKPDRPKSENIDLDIVFEDEFLIAVNKPAGMVVHPAKGHWQGTLTAALMHHFEQLSSVGGEQRPGIVHRLDRDTSGIILIAKTDTAHSSLTNQFQARTVKKRYLAIVTPPPDHDRDEIDQPIGAHPYQREKMAIRAGHSTSRAAETYYEVQSRSGRFSVVTMMPKTGRTHQIRVHLAHIGCPVLCDKLYSGRSRITRAEIDTRELYAGEDPDQLILERQALHAEQIEFNHPKTGKAMLLNATLADDIANVLKLL